MKKVDNISLVVYSTKLNEIIKVPISDFESESGNLSIFVKTDIDVFVDDLDATELTVDEITNLFVDFINRSENDQSEEDMIDIEVIDDE